MIRLLGVVFMLALLLHLLGVSAGVAVPIALVVVVGLFGHAYVAGERLRCPDCGRRIRLGRHVCEGCGWRSPAAREEDS